MQERWHGATYNPSMEDSLTKICIKLHGVTPDQLAPDLKERLVSWLGNTSLSILDGHIRPGCVQLVLRLGRLKSLLMPPPPPAAVGACGVDGEWLGGTQGLLFIVGGEWAEGANVQRRDSISTTDASSNWG